MYEQFGVPGYVQRRAGCLSRMGIFIVANIATAVCTAIYVGVFRAKGGGLLVLGLLTLIAWCIALARWFARWNRQPVLLCPHCGVVTAGEFRVCRSCGRVKG